MDRNDQLRTVSNRLFWSLLVLVAIGIPAALMDYYSNGGFVVGTPEAVFFCGFVGGFVGLQRRLKTMAAEDLSLLSDSWVLTALPPITGAILAELMYLLFVSGLLTGTLFPTFVNDAGAGSGGSFRTLFQVHCPNPSDYAKVMFWSFMAGFSERFVTNVISQFDARGSGEPAGSAEGADVAKVVATKLEVVSVAAKTDSNS